MPSDGRTGCIYLKTSFHNHYKYIQTLSPKKLEAINIKPEIVRGRTIAVKSEIMDKKDSSS